MRACQDGIATSSAAVRRSSLSACGAAVALLAVAVSLWLPSSSPAMRQYSSDFGDRDPCAQAGVGDRGGTLTRTYMDKSRSDKPVSVLLQCSPVLSMRFGTLLADDVFLSGGRSFQGDMTARGWLNTKGHPFIHGDVSEALRLQSLQGAQTVVNALIAAGATVGGTLAVSGIVCAVGGIPTLGIACAGALGALGTAAVGALVSATSAVIKDLIATQVNRIKAMSNADWFVWSNTLVSWNSFGDITDTWVNPSLTNVNPNPFHRVQVRIGVQYSNAAAGGGPDFFSLPATSAPGAAAAAKQAGSLDEQIDSLNFSANRFGIAPQGRDRIRTGGRGRNVLRGGRGDDTLQALGGRDRASGGAGVDNINGGAGPDAISGGRGRDLLFGRSGNDRLKGGPGHDVLIGHKGGDRLRGGPDSDWLIDTRGPTTVRTGPRPRRGRDRVNVRDGRGDDTVICGSRRSSVNVDAGDRVLGRCGKVRSRGPVMRMPG